MTENGNGKVSYKDCMAFQKGVYEKIDQTEQRTLARLEAMERALLTKMDGLRNKVYYNAGVIAVVSSLIISVVAFLIGRGK